MISLNNNIRVRVTSKDTAAQDVCSFELVPECGDSLPVFSPGSHIAVNIPGGYIRQYSLYNNPSERHRYLIAVLRDAKSRGGSIAMHERVNVGDFLTVSPPSNKFPLSDIAESTLLIAGGIGVTPIMSMAAHLADIGARFRMHYCARSRARAAFHDELSESSFAKNVYFHFDDGAANQQFIVDEHIRSREPASHLYVCGPQAFVELVIKSAKNQGWNEDRLHVELFSATPPTSSADDGFEIVLARSDRVVFVEKDQTALEALINAGMEVPASCEQGVCGTCVTRVLDGDIDHRDLYFTTEERAKNDRFTPCCSRGKSKRIVVDL